MTKILKKISKYPRSTFFAIAAFSFLILVSSVNAHSADTHLTMRWPNANGNGAPFVFYNFVEGFPKGAFRDRINDGAKSWSSAGMSVKPKYIGAPVDYPAYDPFLCPAPINGIHKLEAADIYVTYIGTCVQECKGTCGNRNWFIVNTQMSFRPNWSWYTGTGGVNSAQIDLWSTSSRMFGRFMGWTDYFDSNDNTLCAEPGEANYINRQTMCEGTPPFGALAQRDPGIHDIHTMDSAY